MKKTNYKKLALKGILGAFISINATLNSDEQSDKARIQEYGVATEVSERGNMGYHLMTEDELLLDLNAEGEALYRSLDKEGKELARYVASQRCMNSNACKGLNACKTPDHACMGKGQCKGTGKCAYADKNMAVKLVAEKMAEKRKQAAQGASQTQPTQDAQQVKSVQEPSQTQPNKTAKPEKK